MASLAKRTGVELTVTAVVLIALLIWVGFIVWLMRRERRPPS
jgi:hypothetical protein